MKNNKVVINKINSLDEIDNSVQELNMYGAVRSLSKGSSDNVGYMADSVIDFFVKGLFDEKGIKVEVLLGSNDEPEYHVDFDGYKGWGETPAKAIMNLIHELVTMPEVVNKHSEK